jgi:lysophospholipase L1-like esterase
MRYILFLFVFASCAKQVLLPQNSIVLSEKNQVHFTIDTALNIICAGNSLTVGYHLDSPATQAYPAQLDTFYHGANTVWNEGVNGITTEQMEPLINADITAHYDSTKKNIVIAWEIGNDIFWNGTTAKAAVDSFITYCNAVRSHGFALYCVTLPYRNNYYMGYPITPGGDDSTAYTAKIKSVNTMLRSKWATFSSGLIDVAASKDFKQYSAEYYLSDHVHLSAAGYTVVAATAKSILTP